MTYTLVGSITISIYTKVEANSKAEAIEIGEQRDMQALCHYCNSGGDDTEVWSLGGGLDGEPQGILVDGDPE